jgi:hypothetical protein
MSQYGLIFRDSEDEIWLGKYENGTIREFGALSDFDGIYEDLEFSKFAFVEVKDGDNEQLSLRDICVFEIGKQQDEEVDAVAVTEMLQELDFPSEDADGIFGSFLASAGKAN